jgi:hypothetical protein
MVQYAESIPAALTALWERQQPCQQHKLSAALLLLVNMIERLGCTTTTAVGEPATAAGQLPCSGATGRHGYRG